MPSNLTEPLIKKKIREAKDNRKKLVFSDKRNKNLVVEIRPTGSGTYFYRYRDFDERIKHVKIGRVNEIKIKDARGIAQKKAAKVANGKSPQEEKAAVRACPTLNEFFYQVYLPYAKANKKSFATDQSLIGKHVLPVLGHRKLATISKKDAEHLLENLKSKNLSPASQVRTMAIVSHMFTIAIDNEVSGVNENPTRKVKKPRLDSDRARFLTRQEVKRLLKAARNHQHPNIYGIIKLLILTGSRRQEVLHARFKDFDLTNQIWNIPQGKTGSRKVVLSDSAVDFIKKLPKRQGTDLLFPNPKDVTKPHKCIQNVFKRVLRKGGLSEGIRVHDIRHTHASMAIQNGASLPEVKKMLGHKNIMTTTRYVHLLDEGLRSYGSAIAKEIEP